MKQVVIASDVSGFRLKEAVKQHLLELGYPLTDVGMLSEDAPMLYFDAAAALGKAIQSGAYDAGIVICGTGAGVSMVANKFRGVYCVACESVFTAEKISLINNANVLAMGERVVSQSMAAEMAEKFLAGNWCEGFAPERKANNEAGYAYLKELETRF